jgi:two-component system response regulator YesN
MDRRIEKVVSFIKADSSKKIRLHELSRLVNLSPWRLSHLFKQETGMSVVRFVHNVRLEQAKYLLEKTFLSIKEIRTRIGFPEESHFIKAFALAHHAAPSDYRLRYWALKGKKPHSDKPASQQDNLSNSRIGQY